MKYKIGDLVVISNTRSGVLMEIGVVVDFYYNSLVFVECYSKSGGPHVFYMWPEEIRKFKSNRHRVRDWVRRLRWFTK